MSIKDSRLGSQPGNGAIYEDINETKLEIVSRNEDIGDANGHPYIRGTKYIETISGCIYEKNNALTKTENGAVPRFDKSYIRRGSSLEKLFSYNSWTEEKKFLLFSLSVSSGIGCLWRFPSIAYDTGGSFLLCYIIMLILIGMPLYYLESAISQFSSSGPLEIWRCLPALKGIAFSQMAATFYLIIYVGYVMSLSVFFVVSSMQYHLPWQNMTDMKCPSDFQNTSNASFLLNGKEQNSSNSYQISTQVYWRLHVLQSDDINTFTHFNWKLAFCLLLTWIIISLCFLKRSKLHEMLLFVASTYPYIGLLLCFVTILYKDGMKEGLLYGVIPKLEDLSNIKIWYEACVQCFISLGVGFGHVLVYSRYNSFRENIPKNCVFICVSNICTTVLSAILFFSILGTIKSSLGSEDIGSLCYKTGVTDIIAPIFVVYSEGFDLLPQLWIIVFFLILFMSALSNMMIYIDAICSTICQQWQALQKKEPVAFFICLLSCICGLFLTTNMGTVIVNSMDKYGVAITVFVCSIMQVTGILWMYGYKCFFRDVTCMSKSETNTLVKIYYCSVLPVGIMVIGIYGIISFALNQPSQTSWMNILGWCLTGIALIQLPIWVAESYFQAPEWGCVNKIKYICKPEQDWGPADPLHCRDWLHEKTERCYNFDRAKAAFDNPGFENEYTL